MSALCERVRRRLSDYAAELLPAGERGEVRTHLAGCAGCRAAAASVDPTLLFAATPSPEISDDDIAAIVSSVRGGIALRQAERRIQSPGGRPTGRRVGLRLAAAAAVGFLTIALPSGLKSGAPPAAASKTVVPAPVTSAAIPEGAGETSGTATVYDWNPGAGEPRVVWIVDGSLDI